MFSFQTYNYQLHTLATSDQKGRKMASGTKSTSLSSTSEVPAFGVSSDDDFLGIDLMSLDFNVSCALSDWNVNKNVKSKDIACKFHNGFSGNCWKGSDCPYGHKTFSGGIFAEENPVLAAAADSVREVTGIIDLPPVEIVLNKAAHIKCTVAYIESPSEFYILPKNGSSSCICQSVKNGFNTENDPGQHTDEISSMDGFYYGFNLVDPPEGLKTLPRQATSNMDSSSVQESLTKFLSCGKHVNYQADMYFEHVELVAVKVRNEWNRAVVRRCNDDGTLEVFLVDIGQELTVLARDACRLPNKFCKFPPEVYKCCLVGVSPVFLKWAKCATQAFKDLVDGKELTIIIEQENYSGNFSIFEEIPYFVKMLVKDNSEYIDVSEKLIELGVALRWSL